MKPYDLPFNSEEINRMVTEYYTHKLSPEEEEYIKNTKSDIIGIIGVIAILAWFILSVQFYLAPTIIR